MAIFSRLTWEECGPRTVFACYTLAFALQLSGKALKNLIQGRRKVPDGQDSVCQLDRLLRVDRTSCRSLSPYYREHGSTLGQRKYLPSRVHSTVSGPPLSIVIVRTALRTRISAIWIILDCSFFFVLCPEPRNRKSIADCTCHFNSTASVTCSYPLPPSSGKWWVCYVS